VLAQAVDLLAREQWGQRGQRRPVPTICSFASTGRLACRQASKPPINAWASKPRSRSRSAARALDPSFGQVQ
jgi:hypothetical protein